MATVEMNRENLESLIEDSKVLLIDFWANWCGPCKMFGPIFEASSEEHPDWTYAKVDTEVAQDVAAMFGIRSIPTLAIFKEGIMVFKQAGALPKDALEDLLTKVDELDMDEVRKSIEEAEAKKKVEEAAAAPVN